MVWLTLALIFGLLLALEMLMSRKLCRFCRMFLDRKARNNICSRCWMAKYQYPEFQYIPPSEFS